MSKMSSFLRALNGIAGSGLGLYGMYKGIKSGYKSGGWKGALAGALPGMMSLGNVQSLAELPGAFRNLGTSVYAKSGGHHMPVSATESVGDVYREGSGKSLDVSSGADTYDYGNLQTLMKKAKKVMPGMGGYLQKGSDLLSGGFG